jgi:acetyl esterase
MLHPQARALLDFIEQRGIPPTHTLSVADARKFYRERRFATQPPSPNVGEVQELQADGPNGPIPLRLYRPLTGLQNAKTPVLVYFHGGGFVIGDLETHDTLCRELANLGQCAVIAVDYRLGPEHRFPAAVFDCIAATHWVSRRAGELKLDASRLAVGGDSAGGNLAAVVSPEARDRGEPPIAFQLLIYPATDVRATAASHAENGQGYLLTRDTIAYFTGHYIADPAAYGDWRASPLLHADLSNLPPSLVLTAGFDPLRDEGAEYARRLTAAGNLATYVHFPRQIHGFITMGKVIDEANTAVAMCGAELRRILKPGP